MNSSILQHAGIDYQAGMERFMNDGELYEAVLNAFVSDNALERAQKAYQSGNTDALLQVIHEAKGSGGNAGLTELYAEASALLKLLRGGDYSQEELTMRFERFEAVYTKMRDGINAALNG